VQQESDIPPQGEKREEELWVTSRQYNEQGFAAAKAAAFAAEFTASPQLGDWTEPDHLAFNDFTGRMYRRRPFSDSAESLNSLEAIRSQQPWQLNGYRSHRSPRTLMRQYDNLDALISVRRPIDMSVLPPIMEMEEKAESFMESECSEESLFLADNDDPMSSAASSQVNIDIMTGYVDAYEFVKADSKSSWLWTARGQDLQSLERAETQTLQATKSVTSYTSLSPEDVYTYQRAAGPLRITNATVESF